LLCVCVVVCVSVCRLVFLELIRVFNGLLCVSCGVFDLGSMSPLLWSFEERDKGMVFFDFVCGCRMHCAYFCVLGCVDDVGMAGVEYVYYMMVTNGWVLEMFDWLCVGSRLVYLRLRGIGVVDVYDVLYCSVSGVMGRSTGVLGDVRVLLPYEVYGLLVFDYVYGMMGDAQDRFVIRVYDMRYSVGVMGQLLVRYQRGCVVGCVFDVFVGLVDMEIEAIVYVFYLVWGVGMVGVGFSSVESPKGEYSCVVLLCGVCCGRVRVRCADFLHVVLLGVLSKGYLLGDLVSLVGNMDVVFGSVDR